MTSLKQLILGNSKIYAAFQSMLCKKKHDKTPLDNINLKGGETVLDIGCGPAQILGSLPESVKYYGYDLSEEYINDAKEHYKDRDAHFFAEAVSDMNIPQELINNTDLVITTGVLHHLSDDKVKDLFSVAKKALKPGGKFISMDPCFCEKQNPIARFIAKNDRGEFIRYVDKYTELAKEYLGQNIKITTRDDLLIIPYNHIFIEYIKD